MMMTMTVVKINDNTTEQSTYIVTADTTTQAGVWDTGVTDLFKVTQLVKKPPLDSNGL